MHAGVVSTALDSACGYAALSSMPANAGVLTMEFKVNLLVVAKGERFSFRGSVTKPGRTILVTDGRAFALVPGSELRLVATMTGTMMVVADRAGVEERAKRPMEAKLLETGTRGAPPGTTRGMEPRLNFVTLVVADLDRARRFYVDGLGWKAAFSGDDVLMIHVGQKLVLSLWSETGAREEIGEVTRSGTLPFTLAHNVATAAEVDAVLATARAAGAAVHDGQQRPWGGYSGYFVDPEGFRWEVAFNPRPIGGMTFP